MLKWALIAFVISLIAGGLGFTGIATGARTVARVLFGLFLAIAFLVLIAAIMLGQAVF